MGRNELSHLQGRVTSGVTVAGPRPLGGLACSLDHTGTFSLPRAFALPAGCACSGHRERIQSLAMVTVN